MSKFIIHDKQPTFSEVSALVKHSVIAIAVGLRADSNLPNIIGTGFALQYSEFYATCWHVAKVHDDLIKLSEKELSQKGLKDNVLRIALSVGDKYLWREIQPFTWLRGPNKNNDICIYRLIGNVINHLTLHEGKIMLGEEVGVLGFGLGNRLQGSTIRPLLLKAIISGVIDPTVENKLQTSHIAIGTSVAGGFSGSPVFSLTDGRIMGMIASEPFEPTSAGNWPSGISLAVLATDLNNALNSVAIITTDLLVKSLRNQNSINK